MWISLIYHTLPSLSVLIDTWWNVNYINYWQNNVRFICFNRYMVECECNWFMSICLGICVLIDTWWNVNVTIFVLLQQTRTVLIDTWWNVNEKCKKYFCFIMDVLIDTWWNVNLDEIMLRLAHDTVLIDTWWNVNITETTIISTITKF